MYKYVLYVEYSLSMRTDSSNCGQTMQMLQHVHVHTPYECVEVGM